MTDDASLWIALHEHLPRKTWVAITDIYTIVQHKIPLDAEDLACAHSRSPRPRWKSNVRRLLHSKQREGMLQKRKSV